jgi:hypothetical protein
MKLNQKYVFHIPLFKYINGELIRLDEKSIVDGILSKLSEYGYENLYITKAKGVYKKRCFDEILITLFVASKSQDTPEIIFKKWFKENNTLLKQKELAYEYNNTLIIENLN